MKLLILEACLIFSALTLVGNTESTKNVIILMGPPGSGKGTQAVRMKDELKLPHISTGDIFRENIRNQTELGKKAKVYLDAGQLVPDDLVLDVLFERVSKPDAARGYILDGFPRTIPQAEALDKRLGSNTKVIVLNLDVDDELIVKRISGRLTCSECACVYNRYFKAPKTEGKCDVCGGALVQRPDDKEEVVRERLRVYNFQTKPLIEYYKKKNQLINLNGAQEPDQVFADIVKVLRESLE